MKQDLVDRIRARNAQKRVQMGLSGPPDGYGSPSEQGSPPASDATPSDDNPGMTGDVVTSEGNEAEKRHELTTFHSPSDEETPGGMSTYGDPPPSSVTDEDVSDIAPEASKSVSVSEGDPSPSRDTLDAQGTAEDGSGERSDTPTPPSTIDDYLTLHPAPWDEEGKDFTPPISITPDSVREDWRLLPGGFFMGQPWYRKQPWWICERCHQTDWQYDGAYGWWCRPCYKKRAANH
jgi:hypothetical protein